MNGEPLTILLVEDNRDHADELYCLQCHVEGSGLLLAGVEPAPVVTIKGISYAHR